MLGCVCFGWKSLLEILFRKWGCLVGPENRIFRKLNSVDRKKMALTTEIILHFHFHFKVFPEKERERERASAREEEDRAPVQSDDRRRTPSSSPIQPRCRSRSIAPIAIGAVLRKIAIDNAISRRREDCDRHHEITIDDAILRSVDRDLAKHRADRDRHSAS